MKSPIEMLVVDARIHYLDPSKNNGESIPVESLIKELEAARLVIKAVEDESKRPPWDTSNQVYSALEKYYEATK